MKTPLITHTPPRPYTSDISWDCEGRHPKKGSVPRGQTHRPQEGQTDPPKGRQTTPDGQTLQQEGRPADPQEGIAPMRAWAGG